MKEIMKIRQKCAMIKYQKQRNVNFDKNVELAKEVYELLISLQKTNEADYEKMKKELDMPHLDMQLANKDKFIEDLVGAIGDKKLHPLLRVFFFIAEFFIP